MRGETRDFDVIFRVQAESESDSEKRQDACEIGVRQGITRYGGLFTNTANLNHDITRIFRSDNETCGSPKQSQAPRRGH